MAINIQSLFSDIIETPAQRQQRMLTEGIVRGRELTRGLTGLAATQAPLVAALSQQMPRRQDALRRGVGGMLGLDVRTDSEKLQDVLKGANVSTPEGLIQLSNQIQQYAPTQALQLRKAAVEERRALDEAARQKRRQEEADARAETSLELNIKAGERADASAEAAEEDRVRRRRREDEADQRAAAAAERSETTFQNNLVLFEQSQEQRTAQRAASDALRQSLINTLPPESPYLDALKDENAYIPLEQLRLINNENIRQQTPNVELRNIYDPETEKNMIVRLDKDTGEILGTVAEVQRTTPERNVPVLSEDRRKEIEGILEGSKILEENNLFALMGGGTSGDQINAGEALAADLVHSYSEKQNIPLAEVISMLEKQIQDEVGRTTLRTGKIQIQQGEWDIVD